MPMKYIDKYASMCICFLQQGSLRLFAEFNLNFFPSFAQEIFQDESYFNYCWPTWHGMSPEQKQELTAQGIY